MDLGDLSRKESLRFADFEFAPLLRINLKKNSLTAEHTLELEVEEANEKKYNEES